ncbi:MAG TPA: VCBS repeat-containing protein, partial [Blastocatellia bacterium]|nr:VCBS repeat-containing protein [Blastocatellia bacterium]
HVGNREAIFPSTPEAQVKAADGQSVPPFLSSANVFSLPAAPDFLAAGDFDGDGNKDIVAGARGRQVLFLLKGNGHGSFAPPLRIALPGQITTLAALPDSSPDSSPDTSMILVGINGVAGPSLLVYREGQSMMTYPLSAEASSLAVGDLAGDGVLQVAVAAGRQVLIIRCKDLLSGVSGILQNDMTKITLPVTVKGLASGEFISRGAESLAALLEDGSIHLLGRAAKEGGNAEQRVAGPSGQWVDLYHVRAAPPVSPASPSSPQSVLTACRLSSQATDAIVTSGPARQALEFLTLDAASDAGPAGLRILGSLDAGSTPVAVLATRLNVEARPGLVILKQGQIWPTVILPASIGSSRTAGFNGDFGIAAQQAGTLTPAIVPATTVYNSLPGPLPPNVPSLGYQANQTAEFGDLIQFAGAGGSLTQVTLVMSDWALAADFGSTSPTWNHPITLNLYNVNNSGPNPAPGALIATRTQTFAIPWRPVPDITCPKNAWKAGDGNCYNGLAFTITFDFSGTVVPGQIIYGVAFNTETWGYNPIGSPGPYESLNFGLAQVPPTAGSNPFPDTAYWNTATASNYTDGGTGGVGIFRRDTNWTPYSGAISFQTAEPLGSCLQDNVTGDFIHWNSATGDYVFTHCGPNGFTLTGTGMVAMVSSMQTLKDVKPDRNITAAFNTGSLTGSATVTVISGPGLRTTYHIRDTNPHATCTCGT